jgi:hypothetical protein
MYIYVVRRLKVKLLKLNQDGTNDISMSNHEIEFKLLLGVKVIYLIERTDLVSTRGGCNRFTWQLEVYSMRNNTGTERERVTDRVRRPV